jgi:2-phosphosulfolactate phosphatase
MPAERPLHVHLLPSLVPDGALAGRIAVVIDVLRATTVIVRALAAGCRCVVPCGDIDEATRRAAELRRDGKVILAGERQGKPIEGFDLGNSPDEFTAQKCKNATLVMTTTNGTRALLRAAEADRVLAAAFVNFSAVCEQLRTVREPLGSVVVPLGPVVSPFGPVEDRLGAVQERIDIVCAGTDGEVSLEDTMLAGALVDCLSECGGEIQLNDAARLAWDCFENHGRCLRGALAVGRGGQRLTSLGYDADIRAAADVDRFTIVPELRRDPLRLERGAVGIVQSHWPR